MKLSADRSTRTLQITLQELRRAIKQAEAGDLVGRKVAAVVSVPPSRGGRHSRYAACPVNRLTSLLKAG